MESFPNYSGKNITDLRSMPQVRAHGSHLFLAITGIIFNLENENVICELLADLKSDHEKWQPTMKTDNYSVRYVSSPRGTSALFTKYRYKRFCCCSCAEVFTDRSRLSICKIRHGDDAGGHQRLLEAVLAARNRGWPPPVGAPAAARISFQSFDFTFYSR